MKLNLNLKKLVEKKKENPNKKIDLIFAQHFLSLGIQTMLVYLFSIFFIGKFVAKLLNHNNLFLTSIIFGTLLNIYFILRFIKKNTSKINL